MTNYPAKLAVIVPDFAFVDGDNNHGAAEPLVFLNGFAVLKVARAGRGFLFEEVRQVDETSTAGVDLLDALAFELDEDTSVVGMRLDLVVDALVRVPQGDLRDEACKPALQRIRAALGNAVHDPSWLVDEGIRDLEDLSHQYELPAEWRQPGRQANPNVLERQLSARAQSIWLILARELLDLAERRRAHADYDQWRTAHAIV